MNKQHTRRYQIWALAKEGHAEQGKRGPAPARGDDHEEKNRNDRFGHLDLLYTDFGSSARSFTEIDEATSLYRYGLPIEIELEARCTMPNGCSTACKTKKISSESVDFVYDVGIGGYWIKSLGKMPSGSTMHLDVDQIGKFHGGLTLQNSEGFQVAVDSSYKKMLSNKLTHLATAIRGTALDETLIAAKPSPIRLEPRTKSCRFTDHTGKLQKGMIINVSEIDALIKASTVPPVGAHIAFGGPRRYRAEVTRTFEIGFVVKFCPPIPTEEFSAAIKFLDE